MKPALALLLLAGCSLAAEESSDSTALSAADFPPDTPWLERAREAADRSDWTAANFFLDQWAAQHADAPGEDYWELRLRQAAGDNDAAATAAARGALLAVLAQEREDPEEQLRVWLRAARLEEESDRLAEAAALLELAAAHPAAGTRGPAWWERASWMWERAGNRAAATRAIEQALVGVELASREQAALDRLRAFNLGDLATPEDAQAVLRFDANAEARLRAARYLATARFEDDVAVFTRALSDPDPRILQLCLRQLAERADAGEQGFVAARAVPFTSHEDVEVRLAALTALGATGSGAHVPALLAALQPEDRAGFRAARRALETVTAHAEPGPLDPDLEGRRRLREAWLAWWQAQAGT